MLWDEPRAAAERVGVNYFMGVVLLLNFNEKNQVTSPEIFSGGGDVTSVNLVNYPFQWHKKCGGLCRCHYDQVGSWGASRWKKADWHILSNNSIKFKN